MARTVTRRKARPSDDSSKKQKSSKKTKKTKVSTPKVPKKLGISEMINIIKEDFIRVYSIVPALIFVLVLATLQYDYAQSGDKSIVSRLLVQISNIGENYKEFCDLISQNMNKSFGIIGNFVFLLISPLTLPSLLWTTVFSAIYVVMKNLPYYVYWLETTTFSMYLLSSRKHRYMYSVLSAIPLAYSFLFYQLSTKVAHDTYALPKANYSTATPYY